MAKAFNGVRIIDFSQVFAGPFATMQLALLGADVIKIEEPKDGDQCRGIGADNDIGQHGMPPFYLAMNANKRSMTLDLKHPRAAEVIARLVKDADVVVQNFRPGVIDRLGFGYEAMKAIKPDLVYCSVSGFGQTGPSSKAPAYDGAVQAVSGMMSVTGHPECGPTRVGFTVVDLGTAVMAAFAIAGALYRRAMTGQGQHLDVSMLDTSLALMSPLISNYLNIGAVPQLVGNGSVVKLPTLGSFATQGGGGILMSAMTDRQWAGITAAIARPDLAADDRFRTVDGRRAHYDFLHAELRAAFAANTALHWEERLNAEGVPASAIRTIPEILEHPQVAHRRVIGRLPGATGVDRAIGLVTSGFTAGADSPAITTPPPAKGEHTDQVLAEAGYSAEDIAALRAGGALS
jgi:crotonobetainyl-CoA:carnitine CoA-transferase CaiB-like acyl-CoA transferase